MLYDMLYVIYNIIFIHCKYIYILCNILYIYVYIYILYIFVEYQLSVYMGHVWALNHVFGMQFQVVHGHNLLRQTQGLMQTC